MRYLRPFLYPLAVLLAGCGYNVYYTPLNNPVTAEGEVIAAEAPKMASPADVTIYMTQQPQGPYRELGIISIPSASSAAQAEILELFRQKASEVGGDGVILLDTTTDIYSYSTPTYITDWGVFYQQTVRSNSIFRGMAIQSLSGTDR